MCVMCLFRFDLGVTFAAQVKACKMAFVFLAEHFGISEYNAYEFTLGAADNTK